MNSDPATFTNVEKLITYKQYMADSSNLHHAYYMQFVPSLEPTLSGLLAYHGYTVDRLVKLYKEDNNLNNLTRGWMRWMDLFTVMYKQQIIAVNKLINPGHTYSLSDGVCIIKAYMKSLIFKALKGAVNE
jgi:hypothetical protein